MDDKKLIDGLNYWCRHSGHNNRFRVTELNDNIRDVLNRLDKWCKENPDFERIYRCRPDVEPIWANVMHQQPLPEYILKDLLKEGIISPWNAIHGQKLSEDFLLNGGLVECIYEYDTFIITNCMKALCLKYDLSIDFIVKYNSKVCFDCIKKRRGKSK